jgi:glycerol-1-phosphate dehydrogenase [NAD(P)+]
MSIAGSSRPCSGSEHLFSHALDVVNSAGALHGEQCGVGSILITYLYGEDWKSIRDTLKRLGAHTTSAELGVKDKEVVKALELAATIRPDRYTILQKLKLDRAACEKAARETEVIS